MAFDQALLEAMARGSFDLHTSVLRLYSWRPWCVSLGKFQKVSGPLPPLRCGETGLEIETVRRKTGGRAVLHADELTYSLILSEADPLYSPSVLTTYSKISEILVSALKNLGIDAAVTQARARKQMALYSEDEVTCAEAPGEETVSVAAGRVDAGVGKAKFHSGFCFSSPSHYELTWKDLKIAGSAQARIAGAVLQHGSLPLTMDKKVHPAFMAWCGTTGKPSDFMTSLSDAAGRPVDFAEASGALESAFRNAAPVDDDAEIPTGLDTHALKLEPSFTCG